jgi:hypothetical protein
MLQYPRLAALVRAVDPRLPNDGFMKQVVPYLVDVWLDYYAQTSSHKVEAVETIASEYSYLFDIAAERLVAAWGISKGRHAGARDAVRMAGHPLSAGRLYHRGHAIPHTLGGPTDINLVPQLGSINIGPFRPLERKAVATPGSLYFTYWTYLGAATAKDGNPGQMPTGVDQGLLIAGQSGRSARRFRRFGPNWPAGPSAFSAMGVSARRLRGAPAP